MTQQEHLSKKEAVVLGQKYRREARRIFAEYQQALFKKLENVRILIRPRPRYMPRKVWLWIANIFVDLNSSDKALIFETPQEFLVRKHIEAVELKKKQMAVPFDPKKVQVTSNESEDIEDLLHETLSTGGD